MKYILMTIAPSIGVLSALIAILIGQSVGEKYNLKESQINLLVISITTILILAYGALLVVLGGQK